ncbi:MAG: diaminopimelate decarboxylase [Endomicrobiales bacterium]|nr:diaminopimelate decarboxylase [Endomicrobiales bacterium]
MFLYKKNNLFIDGFEVEKLARRFGTPLFLYSANEVRKNYLAFKNAFSGVNAIVCYALKANSSGALLKVLVKSGAGVDITSGGELYRALKAGFPKEKIVYAGIGKTASEIEYALKSNILMFNVESLEELNQVAILARKQNKTAKIAFRINPNVDAQTHKHITTGKSGSKFGIAYNQAVEFYKIAKNLKGVSPVGIHCHIGSQITSVAPFAMAARKISLLVKELLKANIKLDFVDLGGGLGITYKNEVPPTPKELANAVLAHFKDFKGTFIFEPGRFIVGNAGVLVASVTYRKKSEGKNFLITNAGMNDLIRPTLYEAYHDIIPVVLPNRPKVKVDVVGPICETGDFMGKNRMLPYMEQGELLVVKSAGAYGMAMASQYNSRPRACEVLIDGKKLRVIRQRETYETLIGLEK